MPQVSRFDPSHLEALVAIADHGTFDAAARALHVTPSAVSQRIRSLESVVGQVVVQRSTPCRPTSAGEVLLRLARQTRLLHEEAADALTDGHRLQAHLPVAVNADSLATWFRGAVAEVARWNDQGQDLALRLHVEDQAHTAELLRRGEVLGAVTSDAVPVQGCTIEPLGVLRYFPAATPAFAARHRSGRGPDWARMPVVVFNEKDRLQDDLLAVIAAAGGPTGRGCRSWSSTRRTGCRTTSSPGGPGPRSCTGCPPRPTSSRPSASASGGRPSPSPSSARRSTVAASSGSPPAATSTCPSTGSAGGSTHRPWHG
jgi:LysR family transcriptional regulator, chromosome initiation inhibitor